MATLKFGVICCLIMFSMDASLSSVNGLPMIDFTERNKEVPEAGMRISGVTTQCYSTAPTFTWDLVMKNGSGSTSLSSLFGSSVSSVGGGSCGGGNSLYSGSVSASYGTVNPAVFGKTVSIRLTINNSPSVSTISTGSLYFKVYYNLTGSSELATLGQEFVWTCHMKNSTEQTVYAVNFYREETKVGVLGVISGCQMTVTDTRYRFGCVSETEYNLIIPAENLTEYEQNSLWRCSYFSGQSAYSSAQELLLIAIDVYNMTLEPSDNPLVMTEGSQHHLRCTVNANAFPLPTFSWFLDGTDVTNLTGSDTSSIVLTGRRRENGKTLRCHGTNNNKTKTQSVVLDIQYKPEVNASPQSPYTVTEGRTAVMMCTVTTANPSSGITWTWKKTDIPGVILHRNYVYTITNIQRQQAGTYICTATNSVGTSTPALVDVQVQCQPDENSDSRTSIPILGSLFGIFFCLCAGLLTYIFVDKIRNICSKTCFWKTDQNEDYVMHDVTRADEHHYHGIAAEQESHRQKEQSSHYSNADNSGNRDVYDKVEDIKTGEYSNVLG